MVNYNLNDYQRKEIAREILPDDELNRFRKMNTSEQMSIFDRRIKDYIQKEKNIFDVDFGDEKTRFTLSYVIKSELIRRIGKIIL